MQETAEVLFILLVTLGPVAFLFFRAKRKREEEEEQERADALMSKKLERATAYGGRATEASKGFSQKMVEAKRRSYGYGASGPVSHAYQASHDEGFSASDVALVAMAFSSSSRSDDTPSWSGSGGSFSGGGASGSWDSGSSSSSDYSSSDSSSSYSSD